MKSDKRRHLILAAFLVIWLWPTALVADQPTEPTSQISPSSPIPNNTEANRIPANSSLEEGKLGDGGSDGGPGWMGYVQTLAALAIVVVLIFATRILIRRLGGQAVQTGRTGPISVVARVAVGARQQLLLIQLGEKLVLVGQSSAGLSALTEVTDPDEIQRLLDQAESKRSTFAGMLKRKADDAKQADSGEAE